MDSGTAALGLQRQEADVRPCRNSAPIGPHHTEDVDKPPMVVCSLMASAIAAEEAVLSKMHHRSSGATITRGSVSVVP